MKELKHLAIKEKDKHLQLVCSCGCRSFKTTKTSFICSKCFKEYPDDDFYEDRKFYIKEYKEYERRNKKSIKRSRTS